jgi:hypothetical protein
MTMATPVDPPIPFNFEEMVREIYLKLRAEESGHSTEHCVDDQIIAELDRPWDRNDPPNAFGLLERLKHEDKRHWVSPEVSLRMLVSVERLARHAYNEATRAV